MVLAMDSDPVSWSVHTRAPPGETPEERALRIQIELEAKKRSDAIDDDLRRERERTKKEAKGLVKVLLLGQSESGKSTTLKNFRMQYAPQEWDAELKAWRAVIQLNLLKSIITILDALQAEQDGEVEDGAPYTAAFDSAVPYTPANSYAPHGFHTPTASTSYTNTMTPVPQTPYSAQSSSSNPFATPTMPGSSSSTGYPNTVGPSSSRSRSGSQSQQPFRSLGASSGSSLRQAADAQTSAPPPRSRNNSSAAAKMPPPPPLPILSGKHQLLKLRLAPLRSVETDLRKRLGAGADEDYGNGRDAGVLGDVTNGNGTAPLRRKATREFTVRRVKDALESGAGYSHGFGGASTNGHTGYANGKRREEDVDEATEVISSCADDIRELWADDVVKAVLKKRKIRLEDGGGFFLDDVDRIASRTYKPSSDDVVRARLRTLGVQEYRIKVDPHADPTAPPSNDKSAPGKGQSTGKALMKNVTNHLLNFGNEWSLYDVGGSRTGRHAWIPYFECVNAIIFLAPLSCFDERLLEDPRINRLEDSFLLWRTVCSSPLLRNASLILFMNKCDLLKRKLRKGVKVKDYLPSYGDRPNDMGTVVRYLKDKFKDLCRSNGSNGQSTRSAYYYATSVTDTKTTAMTLVAVKDIILREHLKNADFV